MKNLNLRVPDELHARLKALAESDHRSLNAEIVHLLDRASAEQSHPLREQAEGPQTVRIAGSIGDAVASKIAQTIRNGDAES